jgi:hypothetical protein
MIRVIQFDHPSKTPQQPISPQEIVGILKFHHVPKRHNAPFHHLNNNRGGG